MSSNILSIKNYSSKEIKELLQTSPYKEGMKLFAVYLVSKGWSSRKLEDLFDVSFKQITTWIHEFNKNGENALHDKPKTGRNPKLTESDKIKLKKIIENSLPKEYEIDAENWKAKAIEVLIEKLFNIKYKKAQIYNIIKSLNLCN